MPTPTGSRPPPSSVTAHTECVVSTGTPPKSKTADTPNKDGGRNFGRLARAEGPLKDYKTTALSQKVAGIEARHWVGFFQTYSEGAQANELHARIERRLARHRLETGMDSDELDDLLREWAARLPLRGESED